MHHYSNGEIFALLGQLNCVMNSIICNIRLKEDENT